MDYKKTLQQILEISEYAPELNMDNYDEDQVRELNNAMIEIYQIAKGALAETSDESAALHLPVSCPVFMETQKHIEAYQELFNHMIDEHGLTLLESELQEIIRLSDEVKKRYNEASEISPFPSTESKCNKPLSGCVLNRKKVLAKCLKTYPNEDDIQDYCDGKIDAPCDVRIYHKGRKYFVVEGHYDKDYFDVLEPKAYES